MVRRNFLIFIPSHFRRQFQFQKHFWTIFCGDCVLTCFEASLHRPSVNVWPFGEQLFANFMEMGHRSLSWYHSKRKVNHLLQSHTRNFFKAFLTRQNKKRLVTMHHDDDQRFLRNFSPSTKHSKNQFSTWRQQHVSLGICLGWISWRNDDESWFNVLHKNWVSDGFLRWGFWTEKWRFKCFGIWGNVCGF